MSEILEEKVRVVYEDGVFKPLQEGSEPKLMRM